MEMRETHSAPYDVPRDQWLYNDRCMAKWQGWILSDHSADMEFHEKNDQFVPVKPQMSDQDISRILNHAWEQNHQVSIQINDLYDNNFQRDIIGWIGGFDEGQITVINAVGKYQRVDVADIRSVSEELPKKWWLQ